MDGAGRVGVVEDLEGVVTARIVHEGHRSILRHRQRHHLGHLPIDRRAIEARTHDEQRQVAPELRNRRRAVIHDCRLHRCPTRVLHQGKGRRHVGRAGIDSEAIAVDPEGVRAGKHMRDGGIEIALEGVEITS
jgi:hypothetical protein